MRGFWQDPSSWRIRGSSTSMGSVHWPQVNFRVSVGTQRGSPALGRVAVSTAGGLEPRPPRADPREPACRGAVGIKGDY